MNARFAFPALCAGLLAGCTTLAPEPQPPSIVEAIPDTYPTDPGTGKYEPAAWWHSYSDPVLNRLVDEAIAENLDIVQAAARAERAAAQARIARSAQLPTLSAGLSSSYSSSPLSGSPFGSITGGQGPTRIENETYSAALDVAYEVDLFGRIRNDRLAAEADAFAAQRDVEAIRLATIAQVISAYFEIVDTRRQIELTLLSADILQERVELTEDRFASGLAESFELNQVRQESRTIEANLPLLEAALTRAESRLAILLGDYPGDLREQMGRQLAPQLIFEPVPASIPIELLGQRPDVAAAWMRLEAARLRIGARRAERYPAIRLSGSIGAQGGDPAAAFDFANNWALSLASGITAPLFDAGRISAGIRAARADYDGQAAAYSAAVLGAFGEVTDAIETYEEQRQRYGLIAQQLEVAEATLDLQARRYRSGVGSYVAYLDALRTSMQLQSSLSGAARDVALARLDVHRALGGDWTAMSRSPEDME